MAVERLEKYAIDHEMSHQQSEKQSPEPRKHNTKLAPSLPTTLQLHFVALHNLYLGPFETMVTGNCPKVVIVT